MSMTNRQPSQNNHRDRLVNLKEELAAMSDLVAGLIQQYDQGNIEFVGNQLEYEAAEFERFEITTKRLSSAIKADAEKRIKAVG